MIVLALAFACNIKAARAQSDTLTYELSGASATAVINHSGLRQREAGDISIDKSLIDKLPGFIGTSDPLRAISLLPGVQTTSEYQTGIHICGSENSHNYISFGGVPLYGVKHLLGLFSVFNPSHYSGMNFSKHPDITSNRIGGVIDIEPPDTSARKVCGDFQLGMMSAQASLKFRVGKSTQICISGRESFMNLIYGKWMKIGEEQLKYSFGDYNATLVSGLGRNDRIMVNLFYGRDKASVTEQTLKTDLTMNWRNFLASVQWRHLDEGYTLNNQVYCSGYVSGMELFQEDLHVRLPSHIISTGYKGNIKWDRASLCSDICYYDILPQSPYVSSSYFENINLDERQQGLELSVAAEYDIIRKDNVELNAGLKVMAFLDSEKHWHPGAAPSLEFGYNFYRYGKINVAAGYGNQYLFYTGMSNAGLPVEFWFLAGKHSKPQSSLWADLNYSVDLFHGMFSISAGIYARRMYNQVEYNGTLFDFLNASYNLDDFLLKGKGVNFGADIMLQKVSGKFTGWLSYSFGRALRTFDDPDYPGVYPASHERLHEVNFAGNYKLERWTFSGTLVLASGSPFTAPEYLYINSGSVIASYGDYNACRMRPYFRVDVSAGYTVLDKGRRKGEIVLSVYNLTARRNDVMYKIVSSGEEIAVRPVSFMLRIIPSLSYIHKF